MIVSSLKIEVWVSPDTDRDLVKSLGKQILQKVVSKKSQIKIPEEGNIFVIQEQEGLQAGLVKIEWSASLIRDALQECSLEEIQSAVNDLVEGASKETLEVFSVRTVEVRGCLQ